ncbi:DUF1488 family protein [Paenalcaligenes sp. Me52]|uniref:DUF1488 family protein n=1 Tax=Paenalcaligenes sp. Me52 TaxID=3392038 RepID=UPI00143F3213
MQTLVAKYEDDPPGVVFTFLVSGEKVWGWVPQDKLEVLAGQQLSIQGCIETYHTHRDKIQRFVLKQKQQQESRQESLTSRLIKGLLEAWR